MLSPSREVEECKPLPGGFRHIIWDKTAGMGVDNDNAKMTSIAIFAASGGLTAALASYTF